VRRISPLLLIASALVLTLFGVWDLLHVKRLLEVNLNDFGRFYYGMVAWLAGGDPYAPNLATPVDLGDGVVLELLNLGTPPFLLVILPFALLPPTTAIAAWGVVSAASLAVAARTVVRSLELRPGPGEWLVAAAAFVGFAGTAAQLVTGQVVWLLAGPFALAWRASRRDQWATAGALFGLLAAFKPFFLVFGPWLLLRSPARGGGGFALAFGGACAAATLVMGVDAWTGWRGAMDEVGWAWLPMNGSLLGAFARALAPGPVFTPFVDASSWVRPLWLGSAGLVLVVSLIRAWRAEADRAVLILLLGALLAAPVGWVYYHLLVVIPLLAHLQRRPPPGLVVVGWVVAFGFPFAASWLFRDVASLVATVGATYLWGTVGMWLGALRPAPPSHPAPT
jgi:hypothetical protein